MARPEHARPAPNADSGYHAGGPVAAMHQAIETHIVAGVRSLPEWTLHAEARSPGDDMMHQMSRAVGIAALGAGVVTAVSIVAYLV